MFPIFSNLMSRKGLFFLERSKLNFWPRGTYSVHTGYFCPLRFHDYSEVIWCISYFFEFYNFIERRAKWTQFGELRVYLVYTWYFEPFSVQGESQFIRYMFDICYFQQSCILKSADLRAKRTTIWALGISS